MRAIVEDSLDHHCTTSSRSRGCTQDAFDQFRLNSYECRYSALLPTVGDGGCGCFTCTDAGSLFYYLCELHILLGDGGSIYPTLKVYGSQLYIYFLGTSPLSSFKYSTNLFIFWGHTKTIFFKLKVSYRSEAHLELNAFRRKHDCALVIAGDSLEVTIHTNNTLYANIICQICLKGPFH